MVFVREHQNMILACSFLHKYGLVSINLEVTGYCLIVIEDVNELIYSISTHKILEFNSKLIESSSSGLSNRV